MCTLTYVQLCFYGAYKAYLLLGADGLSFIYHLDHHIITQLPVIIYTHIHILPYMHQIQYTYTEDMMSLLHSCKHLIKMVNLATFTLWTMRTSAVELIVLPGLVLHELHSVIDSEANQVYAQLKQYMQVYRT